MSCVTTCWKFYPGENKTLVMCLVSKNEDRDCKEIFPVSANVDRQISVEVPAEPENIIYTLSPLPEITEINTVGDFTPPGPLTNSLDGKYFKIYDDAGSVGVWIDIDDTGTAIPAGAAALDRAIEITTIAANDNADTVATKIAAVLDADIKWGAVAVNNLITLTDANDGSRDTATPGDSGFSISQSQEASTSKVELLTDGEILGKIKVAIPPSDTLKMRSGSVIVTHDALGDGTDVKIGIAGAVICQDTIPTC